MKFISSGDRIRFEGEAAIVTGAGQGIGRGIVLKLAQEGAKMAISDINLESANIVVGEIKGLGYQAIAIETDVADNPSVRTWIKAKKYTAPFFIQRKDKNHRNYESSRSRCGYYSQHVGN